MTVSYCGEITDSVTVDRNINEVFDFISDFSNCKLWDPGVVDSFKFDKQYYLNTVFNNTHNTMIYKIDFIDKPNKVILSGNGSSVKAIDTIEFVKLEDNKTQINYKANISLKGWRKPFIIFLRNSLDQLGKNAMKGILDYYSESNN